MSVSYKHLILSFLITLHMIGVVFMPNLSSYTGERLKPILSTYMYPLGLTGAWSFFAPEPFSPPTYIDYVVTRKEKAPLSGRFPTNEEYFFQARTNRRVSVSRFMISDSANVEFMFTSFLCNEHSDAISVETWAVRGTQPDFKMVREENFKMSHTVGYESEFIGNFVCPARGQKN